MEPNLKYLLLVSISSASRYGRLVLVMDTNFCTDAAGNPFSRSQNSSFYVHYGEFSSLVFFIITHLVSINVLLNFLQNYS